MAPHPPTARPGEVPWGRVVAAGLLAGFTSGLFGVGGGIVIVPALALLAGFPPKLATGTSLTAIVPISLAGAAGYATAGEVDLGYGLLIAAGALAGAVLGTRWLRTISGPALQLGFAALMVAAAVRLVAGGEADGAGHLDLDPGGVVALLALGLGAGVLAGLLGVGGGIVIVPALTIAFGLPLVLAKGTSLAVIIPTAIVGTMRNRSSGLTALRPGLVVGGAGVATALAASQLSLDLDPDLSAALFAGLLVVGAARLVATARADDGEPETPAGLGSAD
ncbi:MAG TPA: sulfite exporter TauE/SafE family protein [Acidimicrobiales bacterium]|nr:sulfite exporter TauE/SafE family protein [Acidimicrobiales bacterium]